MRLRIIPMVGPSRAIDLEAHPQTLIMHLKEIACKMLGIPSDGMRLSGRGRVLDEFKTLREQGAEEEDIYYLFPRAEGG